MQCKIAIQLSGHVVAKTLWHTLWCEQFWHSGDGGQQQQNGDGGQQQQSGDVGAMTGHTCSSDELPPLFCHCFCQLTLILIFLSYSSRFWSVLKGPFLELELGHGLTGAGARLDIWMVFCIQAFRKTAGFDLEISCGWFPLKRDRLRKQRTEAAKKKFSDVINFVDSDRLLIGSFERKRKESSCFCPLLPSCCSRALDCETIEYWS